MDINRKSNLLLYCTLSTFCCFLAAWGLFPTMFGGKPFPPGGAEFCFFLAIAPGIIIGAIIYFILKPGEKESMFVKPDSSQKVEKKKDLDNSTSLVNQLREIKNLHEEGILSEEEFSKLKKEILDKGI